MLLNHSNIIDIQTCSLIFSSHHQSICKCIFRKFLSFIMYTLDWYFMLYGYILCKYDTFKVIIMRIKKEDVDVEQFCLQNVKINIIIYAIVNLKLKFRNFQIKNCLHFLFVEHLQIGFNNKNPILLTKCFFVH